MSETDIKIEKSKTENSDIPEIELNSLHTTDKYPIENFCYSVMGYTIEVENENLAAAIDILTPTKRDVVLLYSFMEMKCTAIGKLMSRNRCTVSRSRSIAPKYI